MVAEPKIRDWWPSLEDMCLDSTAVIVLNTNIDNPPMLVRHLWNNASLRLTVDGGTNKWYNFIKHNKYDNLKFPDLITGDLDSADSSIVEHFVLLGSQIVHTPDQDETDFAKALREVQKFSTKMNKSINSVIVMANMCNRVDHFLSNISTLYRSKDHYFDGDIYLLGRNSLTWLLQTGSNRIHVPQALRINPEKNYIGIFPMGSPCYKCTTTGLKWNICGKLMELGGLTSSSNTYNGDSIVTISNSSPLLWTMTMGYEDGF